MNKTFEKKNESNKEFDVLSPRVEVKTVNSDRNGERFEYQNEAVNTGVNFFGCGPFEF